MTVLIKKARITDPLSPFHDTLQDILIQDGIIRDIGTGISGDHDTVIERDDLLVSPGWVDSFAHFCDPGQEFRETLETGAKAAAAGGFTDVMIIPNTKPVTDNKSQVEYLGRRSSSLFADIHPIGAISKNTEGKELAEMYDMRNSGAVAFSDGLSPVQSSGLMMKALQYVKAFDGVVIQIPDDKSVGAHGLMHEGIVSTRLGLAGKPMMAEELLVARDIKLVRYTESKLHFTGVTSPRSLEYIRRAKDAGLQVTCSVAPYHLHFTDEDLKEYDTNLKVYPPLRGAKEKETLLAAVKDGTVDLIASHHLPQDYDSKVLEFEYAKNGMTGLETSFYTLYTALPELNATRITELLAGAPRSVFGLPAISIQKGQAARLTLFSLKGETTLKPEQLFSRSRNSALLNTPLKGRIFGTVRGTQVFIHPQQP